VVREPHHDTPSLSFLLQNFKNFTTRDEELVAREIAFKNASGKYNDVSIATGIYKMAHLDGSYRIAMGLKPVAMGKAIIKF
jgi:hypothetical protein